MASLYFHYSAMNAGKTTDLLQAAHNYKERGMRVLLLTPSVDDRVGYGVIRSRIGIEKPAMPIDDADNLLDLVSDQHLVDPLSAVMVDEAQFLTEGQVWHLSDVVDKLDIPVLCYGLRTDAFGNTFEGSERLLALADKLVERKTVCHCGRKATMTLRRDANGNVVKTGCQTSIGDTDTYESVCRKHYKEALGI